MLVFYHSEKVIHCTSAECRLDLQKLVGYAIPNAVLHKAANLAQRLSGLQENKHGTMPALEMEDGGGDNFEFGSDLVFRPPARFLVDASLEDLDFVVGHDKETLNYQNEYSHDYSFDGGHLTGAKFDLEWLRDACDRIVSESTSQLPRDELAMAICRVLDSEKPGDEVT